MLATAMSEDTPNFEAGTNFEGDEATVAPSENFENEEAVELEDILNAAIDRQPALVVLDATDGLPGDSPNAGRLKREKRMDG